MLRNLVRPACLLLCLAPLPALAVDAQESINTDAASSQTPPTTTEATPWLEKGRQAISDGNYAEAITALRKAMSLADREGAEYRTALEFLGVAYERGSSPDRAESTYERYLARYPEGEDSDRVRQRLTTLRTSRSESKAKLKFAKQEETQMEYYGSFSQFSIRDTTRQSSGGFSSNSALLTDFDLTGRYRSERYDVRTQVATSHRHQFEFESTSTSTTTPVDDLRLSSLYASVRDKKLGLFASVGRQTGSSGGVLGRYDGALISYDVAAHWKVNMVAGVPVELSGSSDSNRYFYGLSIDAGTFKEHWDFNGFVINQMTDQIVDRRAVGGEVRYHDRMSSYFGLIDYDTIFSRLNSTLLVANWFFPDSTTVNVVADYRTSPSLSAENALIGQAETSVGALLARLSEAEVRSLALDRTFEVSNLTVSATRPLNQQYQVSADVTLSRQSSAPESGGVPEVASSGNQYFYSLQLIGAGVIKADDVVTASLRHSETISAQTSSVDMNMRYPLTKSWRADPRFGIDYQISRDKVETVTLRPSFRMDYAWKRNVNYDVELGAIWSDDFGNNTGSNLDFNFELGYRVDF